MQNLLISLLILILFSCGTESETVSNITIEDAPEFFKLADSSAIVLVKTLGGRLTEVIQSDGVIKAIDVCKEEAYDIADSLKVRVGENISIKRVSDKYRNPKNAPDKYEKEALEWFENQLLAKNVLPKFYGQRISRNNRDILRFYKPMKMQTKCLLCHGDEDTRLPEVSKRINNHYPNDLAKNYKDGDFRGLIRVEVQ